MAITNDTRSIIGHRNTKHLQQQLHQHRRQQAANQATEQHIKHVSRASGTRVTNGRYPQAMRVSRRLLATVIVLSIAAHGVSLTTSSWLSPIRQTQTQASRLTDDTQEQPKLHYLGRARLTPGQLNALNEHTDNNLLFVARHSDQQQSQRNQFDDDNSNDDDFGLININPDSDSVVTDQIESESESKPEIESDYNERRRYKQSDYDNGNDFDEQQAFQDQAARSDDDSGGGSERRRVMSRAWDALLASLQPVNDKQLVSTPNGQQQQQQSALSQSNSPANFRTLYSSHRSLADSNTNDVITDDDNQTNSNNVIVDKDNDNTNDTASEDIETNPVSIVSPIVTSMTTTTTTTQSNDSTTAIPAAVLAQANTEHGQTFTSDRHADDDKLESSKRDSIMSTASIWWRHPFNYLSSLLGHETATKSAAEQQNTTTTTNTTPAPTTTTSASSTTLAPIVQSPAQPQLGWIDTIRSYLGINQKRAEGQKELEEEDNLGKQEREAELALAASLSQNQNQNQNQHQSNQLASSVRNQQQQQEQQQKGAHKSAASGPATVSSSSSIVREINLNRDDAGLSTNRLSARTTNSNINGIINDDDDDDDDVNSDVIAHTGSNLNSEADNLKAARQNLLSYLMSSLPQAHNALFDSESSERQDNTVAAMLRRSSLSANLIESYTDSPLIHSHYSQAARARSYGAPLVALSGNSGPFMQPVVGDHNGGSQRAPVNDLYFIVLVVGFSAMTVAVVLSAGLFAYRAQTTRKSVSDVDYPTYGVVGPSLNSKPGAGMCLGGASIMGTKSAKSSVTGAGSTRSLADLVSPCGSLKASQLGGSIDQLSGGMNCGAAQQRVIVSNSNNNNGNANASNNSNQLQQQQQTDKQQSNQNAARMYHYHHQKQQMITSDKASAARHTSASDCDSDDNNDDGAYTVYECPGLASTHEMEVKNPLFLDDLTPVSSPAIKQ